MNDLTGTRSLRRACLAFLAGASSLALTEVAQAEAPSQPQGLEEIVVTAQRRTELLQTVPIQVAAFSAAKIEDAGIRNTRDFLSLVPNVSFDEALSYLNSFITVRGVTEINNADSPVAVVVDGVPQNSQKQLKMNLFDIERIEVLKGPQGGLYGRNAIGGAINIVTKAPSDHFEGFAEGSYGRGDAIELAGGVSAPLAEGVALRVAGSYKTDDGRIRNVFRGDKGDFVHHDWELRGKLNAELSDSIKVDLRASYRDFDGFGPINSIILSGRSNDYQPPRTNLKGIGFGNIFDASAKADVDLGSVTLTSITAYTDIKESYRGDLDMSNPVDKPGGFLGLGFPALQAQDLRAKLTSQELRLVSDSDQPLRWIIGAYYLHAERALRSIGAIDIDGTYAHIDDPALQILQSREVNKNNAYAAYANVDFDITEQLTLSGAFRYDYDHRRQKDRNAGTVRKTHFESPQPKATVTYKFTRNKLVYATFSKGFRSGGFNSPISPLPIYKAETLENYEMGFKTSWMGNRVIVNGAVYQANDKNSQYFFTVPAQGQIIANIDKVRIRGVELDVQALVAPGFQLFGSLGTTDTNIRRNKVDPSVVGNKSPRTVPWTTSVGFQYERPLTDDLGLMLRTDYQHRSKRYWEADNLHVQEALDLVDVRAGIQADRWSIMGFGRNIFGEKYYADYGSAALTGFDADLGALGQPASYGIELRYKF